MISADPSIEFKLRYFILVMWWSFKDAIYFVCLCWIHMWLCNQVSRDVLYLISLYTFWRPQALLPMQRSQWLCRNAWAGNETHAGYTYIQLTACCSARGECRCHSFGRLVLELCLYTWSMVLPAKTSDCFTTAIITASIHTNVYNKRCVQCCSPFGLKAWRPIHTKETLNPYLSIWLSSQLQTALHIMSEYSVEISSRMLYIW